MATVLCVFFGLRGGDDVAGVVAIHPALPSVFAFSAGAGFDCILEPLQVLDAVAAATGEGDYVVKRPTFARAGGGASAGAGVDFLVLPQDRSIPVNRPVVVPGDRKPAHTCIFRSVGRERE